MPASEPAFSTPQQTIPKHVRTRSVVVEPPIKALDGRDRRQHSRHPMDRPAKLFCPRNGRFFAGRTLNISAGGVLVEIDATESIEPEDEIQMTIAFGDRFIVPMSEMVPGAVVRTCVSDDAANTCLAIAYNIAAETAISA